MCHDIDSLIVDVEQTTKTLSNCHERPVTSEDVRIELQMLRHVAPSSEKMNLWPLFSRSFLVHLSLIVVLAIEQFRATSVLKRRICHLRMMIVSKRRRADRMFVRNVQSTHAHAGQCSTAGRQVSQSSATVVSLLHQLSARCCPSTTIRNSGLSDGAVTTETASILFIARENAPLECTRPVSAGLVADLTQKCRPETVA